MIGIYVNNSNFVPDVQPLVRAFFEGEEAVLLKEEGVNENIDNAISVYIPDIENEASNEPVRVIFNGIEYTDVPRRTEHNATYMECNHKVAVRNCTKRLLYKMLSKQLKKELPWGALTGIRPTRIAMTQLKLGKSCEEAAFNMREQYMVSEERARLSAEIAKRELDVTADIDYSNGYSLYIGIPFCPSTCLYCSFGSNSIFAYRNRINDYLEAVGRELRYTAELFKGKKLNTIYVGGGTPTSLEAPYLERLLSMVDEYFDTDGICEYTVESGRPDSINEAKLEVMKKHRVSRISINPQTFKDETLKTIGRHHTGAQTISAFKMARAAGFDNINMDIILALPDEDIKDVENTLSIIKELGPESLTVHSLAVKRASRLQTYINEHECYVITNTDEMIESTLEAAKALEMNPYYLYRQKNMAGNFENVGYSKEGKEGIYNILMMEEMQTIAACGAGTISKCVSEDGSIKRCDNVKDVELYISKIEEMIDRKRGLFKD